MTLFSCRGIPLLAFFSFPGWAKLLTGDDFRVEYLQNFLGENMKPFLSAIVAIFIAAAALTAKAQTTAPPVAQTAAAPTKIAVIDTEAFTDSKAGIKRLINVYTQINNEVTPKRQEITTMTTRYEALAQKANAGTLTQAEAEEANNLKRDIQRKQEDGQKLLETLTKTRTAPILTDIGNALQTYAKQRGFDMVLDMAKFQGAVLILNQGVDITDAFILDYNAKNPGTAAATPPK